MYRRYQPNNQHQSNHPQSPAPPKQPQMSKNHQNTRTPVQKTTTSLSNHQNAIKHNKNNFLGGLIPPSLYNGETKKVLGFLSAEDLLLVALILLFMDNEDTDPIIIYALIYILVSEYIDLPDILGF